MQARGWFDGGCSSHNEALLGPCRSLFGASFTPCSIGGRLEDSLGQCVVEFSEPIGYATNNVAEYQALVHLLVLAIEHGVTELVVYTDSQLIARQVTGQYTCREPHLAGWCSIVRHLCLKLASFEINWVPRKENQRADELATAALRG